MDIFGIGPLELLFIVIIILLVLGPKEMVSALRTIGKVLRSIVTSDWWSSTKQTIQDVRKLPYDLMREAGMEEDMRALDEIRSATKASTRPPTPRRSPGDEAANLSAWTNPPPPAATEIESLDSSQATSQEIEPSLLPPGIDPEDAGPPPADPAESGKD
jgi:Sec-independent protein translocase protein TatA